jgi:lipoprotein signal peptidase
MLRIVLAVVIGAHGFGHILFLMPLLGNTNWGQSTQSWLLGGDTPAHLIGSLLWIVTMLVFGAAAYGLVSQYSWWRNAAILAAVVSLVGLIIFWANPATSPAISALGFDLLVLGALLIIHFPSIESVGA